MGADTKSIEDKLGDWLGLDMPGVKNARSKKKLDARKKELARL